VFLAIGKQTLGAFAPSRSTITCCALSIRPGALAPARLQVILARGPFDVAGDMALMRTHRITHVVAKNAGGAGAEAKLMPRRAALACRSS
jgi:precorrin-6A/cobalt-precorrin-6A reductase